MRLPFSDRIGYLVRWKDCTDVESMRESVQTVVS